MVYINKKTFKAYYRLFACMHEDGYGCEAVIPFHLFNTLSSDAVYKSALRIPNEKIDNDYHLAWSNEQFLKVEFLIREFGSSFSDFKKTPTPDIKQEDVAMLNEKIAASLKVVATVKNRKNNNTFQW